METLRKASGIKRLRNRYRLLIMNDDTFEEVITFKLTRLSIYALMSTIFVILTGLTIAVISFTPLRFLVPGYGKQSAMQELRELKLRTDSMEKALGQQQQYFNDLQKVLKGDQSSLLRDTTLLTPLPPLDESTD